MRSGAEVVLIRVGIVDRVELVPHADLVGTVHGGNRTVLVGGAAVHGDDPVGLVNSVPRP
jgi:hypothetical protein